LKLCGTGFGRKTNTRGVQYERDRYACARPSLAQRTVLFCLPGAFS